MTDKEKIAYLEVQNTFLSAENQSLSAKLYSQSVEIASLQEKVTQLLELLQKRGIKKHSGNSSLAPSQDLGNNKNKSLRPKSDRKSGGQKGHKGNTLQMTAHPDKIIDLKSTFCSECGTLLPDELQVLQAKRQVVEIPPIVPIYEEYRQHSCTCPECNHFQKAEFPAHVNAPIQYGSSIVALTSYFSVYQYIPFHRLKSLFSQVFNLPISEGSVDNMLHKAAAQCEPVYAAIKEDVAQSQVVGSDETGAKVNGAKWWIWVWQTAISTFIAATKSRGSAAVNSIWENGLPIATLISDRWAAQLKTQSKNNQICLAHLLRDLNFLIEKEAHEFATDFKTLLIEVFVIKKEQVQNQQAWQSTEEKALIMENRLNQLLSVSLSKEQYPETMTFQQSMLKYRNYLLPCLYNLEIPPDNNASERAIRNVKVKQKVSGQFKTGQHDFCVIRSVIDTLLKRKIELLPTLKTICQL